MKKTAATVISFESTLAAIRPLGQRAVTEFWRDIQRSDRDIQTVLRQYHRLAGLCRFWASRT